MLPTPIAPIVAEYTGQESWESRFKELLNVPMGSKGLSDAQCTRIMGLAEVSKRPREGSDSMSIELRPMVHWPCDIRQPGCRVYRYCIVDQGGFKELGIGATSLQFQLSSRNLLWAACPLESQFGLAVSLKFHNPLTLATSCPCVCCMNMYSLYVHSLHVLSTSVTYTL